jgi:hypothetical protein
VIWRQEYACWKCQDRLECPQDDAQIWTWPRTEEARAFEAKHAACDDGQSVGMTLGFEESLHEQDSRLDAIASLVAAHERGDTSELDEIFATAARAHAKA